MDFLTIVVGIVLLIFIIRFEKRLKLIEAKLQLPAKPANTAPSSTPLKIYPPNLTWVRPASPNHQLEDALRWFKEDWILKLGALLLLIGFGWFVRYAFLNNWIGPMGRIALGLMAGTLILILGWWRMKHYLTQGGIFTALGSTIILLTIFAAREIYGFFTPLSALIVMGMSTALVALASVHYRTQALALTSLALSGLAPLLTNAPLPNYIGLFSYLMIVVAGTIWITLVRGWRELTAAALLLVGFYSFPHYFSLVQADANALLAFAFAFSAIFFITNASGILKLKNEAIAPDLITAGGNGLFLLAWILTAAQEEWKSLIIAAWMIVFAGGAFILFRATGRREPFYVYAGVSLGLLAAATAVEFDGPALTLAYTIESSLLPLIIYYVLKDLRLTAISSLVLIGPALLSQASIVSPAWQTSVFHDDFAVLALFAAASGILRFFFWQLYKTHRLPSTRYPAITLSIASSLYIYILLWLSLHAAFANDDLAVLFSLVAYTIVALATYFYAETISNKLWRIYGMILLGFVVSRLLLIDIWELQLVGRILTFFAVGTLLASTAFIGRNIGKHSLPSNSASL